MRTITVTGGFVGTVKADLTDELGDLSGATVRAALVPEDAAAPQVGNAAWKVAAEGAAGLVTIVADGLTAGHYWLAVDVERAGRHELVWARDAERPERRALIRLV